MTQVPSAPVGVRLAGLVLAAFGSLILFATLVTASGVSPPYSALDYGIAVGLIVLGVALVVGLRWAGVLAMVAAFAGFVLGVVAVLSVPDVALPGSNLVVGFLFIAPSVLILVALLTRNAREWLRGRERRT